MLKHRVMVLGGSVGSLQPLMKIFDHTPLDKDSCMILQQLAKSYKSHLQSILARHSKPDVVESNDNSPIENDKVYYAPPDDFMTICDGKIQLVKRKGGANQAIDVFLQSLAINENHRNTIAETLAGSGTDVLR